MGHLCAGIFYISKACVTLPKDGQHVGCHLGAMCFRVSLQSVVETFAQRVLIDYSDVEGIAKPIIARRTYVSAMDRFEATGKMLM